jgi:polyisoprenoid-binding protein YceI
MARFRLVRAVAPLLLAVAGMAFAQPIQPAGSKVTATFTQMGVAVDAEFRRFGGDIVYDPNHPDRASARVSIEVASFDLGDPAYNQEVLRPEWFDASRHPEANFVSRSVKVISPQRLEVTGELTIKGRSETAVVPMSVTPEGSGYAFSGELPISRTTFRVGEGEWSETDLVADEVKIRFHILTAQ